MQKQFHKLSMVLGAMLTGALLTGVVTSLPSGLRSDAYADQQASARSAQQNLAKQNLSTAQDLSTAFRNVADAIRPSVVSISTARTMLVRGGGGMNELPPEFRRSLPPGFEDFFDFDRRRGNRGNSSPERRRMQTGMGSGVIVRADGYILTNNHVVANADEVTVELSDGTELTAEVVGTDPPTDLAVLKVDQDGLMPVAIGSSDNIQVGDWVLAIGSPFGLDQTVTAGIISGKNRVQGIVGNGNGYEDFLQTDAAINPGNSGGPLVNLRGELVGINTAIASRSGGNNGIGFAIPVSLAKPILSSIIETGKVQRGFLGAQVGDVNSATSEEFGLKVKQGALISSVLDDQPAAQAGLQPGDVVTDIDGKTIRSGTQLRNYVASRKPGSTINMTVNRNGNEVDISVKLGELNEDAIALFSDGGTLGVTVQPLTSETAKRYGYDADEEGLLVTGVEDGSAAAEHGIQPGDIIKKANGEDVRSDKDLEKAAAAARQSGQSLRLTVRRENSLMMIPVPLD
ncbi:DegQ family serine endoprotease [Crateriforma spongiae]|uniref:DegQ family serine endoprotease n=1 Tax=Crateriforma spongiae TaxID=2724528 RepID=UPI0039AEF083